MSQENVEVVRRIFELRGSRDWDASRALFAPDCEFDYSRSGSEVFEEFGWEPDEFMDAGDAVVVPGRFYSRGRGNGVETAAWGVEVNWLVDGKVVRWRLCQDRAEALAAAGLRE